MLDPMFVVNYISQCAKKEILPNEAAKQEIEEIDLKLKEAEELRHRRQKLVQVLDHLGDDSYKRKRTIASIQIESDDSEEAAAFRNKLLSFIGKEPMTMRDLIIASGSYEQDIVVCNAVKWLGEREIVSRDSEGRIVKGPNWKS